MTGLCGSDAHYEKLGRNGIFEIQHPMVLGHESAGQIVAIGSSVASAFPHLTTGTRVALEAGQSCSQCFYCLKGRYNVRRRLLSR